MRVIAGKYKRRLLKTLPGTDVTRPTSDRVKESLFNMLSLDIQGAIVWDLFAGSGALGIEALSRGAEHVTFVEESQAAYKMILENLKTLGVPAESYTVVCSGVADFLARQATTRAEGSANHAPLVSVVLADPPYHSPWYDVALHGLALSGACSADCLIVLEMKAGRAIPLPKDEVWELADERKYGIAQLQFWRFHGRGGQSENQS